MADEQNPAINPGEQAAAQFQIQKMYIKDASFELPNAPQIFQDTGQADVKMSLAQRVESMDDGMHEVILTVTVTAMVGEKTAYLAEVAQAGVFLLKGFNEQATHAVINTLCPNTLFPYARHTISTLVAEGGFPPLILQPVNFDQLYAQRMQEMAEQQQQQGADGIGAGDPLPSGFSTNN